MKGKEICENNWPLTPIVFNSEKRDRNEKTHKSEMVWLYEMMRGSSGLCDAIVHQINFSMRRDVLTLSVLLRKFMWDFRFFSFFARSFGFFLFCVQNLLSKNDRCEPITMREARHSFLSSNLGVNQKQKLQQIGTIKLRNGSA